MRRPRPVALLIPILLLAFGLRVWGLAEHNIWWDEGIGVWVARQPVLEGIRWTATDSHPPLHYILLRGWWQLAGEGEFVLRFPSVVAGLLTVVFTYKLGQLLGNTTTGCLAALLVALSRFSIIWSQEIRMYGLATTLATGSLWSAVRLWRASRASPAVWPWRAWLAFVGFTVGALFTLYLTGTVVAVTNLAFLVVAWHRRRRRGTLWPWITAQVAVVTLLLPWLFYALPRMHSLSTEDPFDPGFFLQLYATMLTVGSPLDLERYVPWIITILASLAIGVIAISRKLATASLDAEDLSEHIGGLVMLLIGLLLPPLAVVVVALPQLNLGFSRSVAPRYLLPLSACYAVLLAWGVTALTEGLGTQQRARTRTQAIGPAQTYPQRSGSAEHQSRCRHPEQSRLWRFLGAASATLALLAAVSGLTTFYTGRARRDDYVTIAEILRLHRHPTDAVVLYVDRDWPIFAAHYAGPRQDLPYGADLSDPAVAASALMKIWETSSAVWLVSTPESLQADPLQAVPHWLAAQAAVTQTLVSGENTLTLYARSGLDARVRETMLPGAMLPARVTTPHSLVGFHLPLPRYRTGDTIHLGLYWIPPVPEGIQVTVENAAHREHFKVAAPTADLNIARSQVDIPLTPGMPGGTYQISINVPGFAAARVGSFKLIASAVGDGIAATSIPHQTNVEFGDTIELVGYALPTATASSGEAVALTLYWRTKSPLTERYKVFTHLLGETFNAETGNFLWGQQDNEPGGGQSLTTLWSPNTIVADSYRIPVDPQTPPGTYTIEIGMYGLVDGLRLPARARGLDVADDAVLLVTVVVQ